MGLPKSVKKITGQHLKLPLQVAEGDDKPEEVAEGEGEEEENNNVCWFCVFS
ncbi:MAG: hypothetical protein NZ702_03590 [Gammaproteobacteria bacterium]|nr:hypothetical protein [Gammaproteobacteria bacterium]